MLGLGCVELVMCGRVIQKSGPLRLAIVEGLDVSDSRIGQCAPTLQCCAEPRAARHSAEPQDRRAFARSDQMGPNPYWCKDPRGGRKPINAKAESVSRLPMFRDAYAQRRCIVPVDGFFEWRAIKGARAKQPYAIAMKDGSPFGLAGLWENWRNPNTGEWERTFAIITVPSNELVGSNPQPHARNP